MNLNGQELEILRQALYGKAYKLEKALKIVSPRKTQRSANIRNAREKELQETIALLERVQEELIVWIAKNF